MSTPIRADKHDPHGQDVPPNEVKKTKAGALAASRREEMPARWATRSATSRPARLSSQPRRRHDPACRGCGEPLRHPGVPRRRRVNFEIPQWIKEARGGSVVVSGVVSPLAATGWFGAFKVPSF